MGCVNSNEELNVFMPPEIVTFPVTEITSLPFALLDTNVPLAPPMDKFPPIENDNLFSFDEGSTSSTPITVKVSCTAKKLILQSFITLNVATLGRILFAKNTANCPRL